jgi:hypothetical protein
VSRFLKLPVTNRTKIRKAVNVKKQYSNCQNKNSTLLKCAVFSELWSDLLIANRPVGIITYHKYHLQDLLRCVFFGIVARQD